MDELERNTGAFVSWFENRGGYLFPGVEIADFRAEGMGRGLRATKAIDSGDQLLRVPASTFLHSQSSPEVAILAQKHHLDEWSTLIVTMMALENTPEWKPYFDILPSQFNTPMFWDPAEVKRLLSPSGVVLRIGHQEADEMYSSLAHTILKEPLFAALPQQSISRLSFHRFGSIVLAYGFDVPAAQVEGSASNSDVDEDERTDEYADEDEEKTTKVLIPLADLINETASGANVEFTNVDFHAGLVCAGTTSIGSSQQLFLPRTNVSSGEMLRRYGYIDINDRSLETVDISVDLVKSCAVQLGYGSVDEKVDRVQEYVGELDTFELAQISDEQDEQQLNYDDDLLLLVTALSSPEVKRKYLKNVVDDFAERETMTLEAKALLEAILTKRRSEYGEVVKPRGVISREEMADYVRWSEADLLDSLLEGLVPIKSDGPAPKRVKMT